MGGEAEGRGGGGAAQGGRPAPWRPPPQPYGVVVGAERRDRGGEGPGAEGAEGSKEAALSLALRHADYEGSSVSLFMGKAYRSCITGRVRLKRLADCPDFSFADLWARRSLYGSMHEFTSDKYLFRTVPLTYRTWIYHDLYRRQKKGLYEFRDSLIQEVLSHRCIDAPVRGGRWSPLMLHAPAAMMACLTGDLVTVLLCIFAVTTLFVLAKMMNDPDSYRYTRVASLPVRLGVLLMLVVRSNAEAPPDAGPLRTLGFSGSAALMLLDILLGEGGELVCYRFLCSYEIFRELPERIFVCKRHGAAHLEDTFGERGSVDECVTGTGSWERNYILIADLQGLLVELRPVQPKEWERAALQYYESRRPLSYVRIDAFAERRCAR